MSLVEVAPAQVRGGFISILARPQLVAGPDPGGSGRRGERQMLPLEHIRVLDMTQVLPAGSPR